MMLVTRLGVPPPAATIQSCARGAARRAPGRAVGRARRRERDARAVGRPARRARRPRLVEQLLGRRAAVGRRDPDARNAAVRRLVDALHDVHDARAVGRDARIRDELELEIVFGGDAALWRLERGSRRPVPAERRTKRDEWSGRMANRMASARDRSPASARWRAVRSAARAAGSALGGRATMLGYGHGTRRDRIRS